MNVISLLFFKVLNCQVQCLQRLTVNHIVSTGDNGDLEKEEAGEPNENGEDESQEGGDGVEDGATETEEGDDKGEEEESKKEVEVAEEKEKPKDQNI